VIAKVARVAKARVAKAKVAKVGSVVPDTEPIPSRVRQACPLPVFRLNHGRATITIVGGRIVLHPSLEVNVSVIASAEAVDAA